MLNFLKREANKTLTENGAVTLKTSCSDCLDLFATIGALRYSDENEIITRFIRAYAENSDLAMKMLFFARDVREGLGERRVFRIIMEWLAKNEKYSVLKNMEFIPEYGRYDDLLTLLDSDCRNSAVQMIKNQLNADIISMQNNGQISLLAKWLPSINASNKETVKNAKMLARMLGMNDVQYRKTLSSLRSYLKLVENNLRERDYTFDYSKVPSKAMHKYISAFLRNDNERYKSFLSEVERGEAKLNTSTLTPYDVIAPCFERNELSCEKRKSINIEWNNLEDFTNNENAIAVVDGSGSMYFYGNALPAKVALSLGIYFAEHNKGAFYNHFITFSENPQLVEIKGADILEKVRYCKSYNEIANTNIAKTFELILVTAVRNKVPQKEMPTRLYIISDMEFDICARDAKLTNFEYAKKLFEQYDYKLPEVVFWNVASRTTQQPVKKNEQGVALVSGCSPRIFSMIAGGELSPYKCMMDIIGSERYKKISA